MIKRILTRSLILCILLFHSVVIANQDLPEFTLKSFPSGEVVEKQSLSGKVLYIDFWASWCVPCRKTFPFMNELEERFGSKGLEIIAINMDEDLDDAEQFLQRYPANFDIFTNENNQLAKELKLPGLPVAYIVDKKGQIRARHVGFKGHTKEKALKQIAHLLEEQ